MDDRAKELIKNGDNLFSKRAPMVEFWQEAAENFNPIRADFTAEMTMGRDLASNLSTSYPLLCQRELEGAIGGMLRPTEKDWFHISIARDDKLTNADKAWLEAKTKVMKRAMYDRVARFTRAMKEGDSDYATFGQCVISTERNLRTNSLLYRSWHLRDVAWCENVDGDIDTIHRNWKPTARDLLRLFGAGRNGTSVHQKVREAYAKDPYQQFRVRHVIIPSDFYESSGPDNKRYNQPYVGIWVDVENGHIMEESGRFTKMYTIPRWKTVSGSQYAYSPSVIAALPDARLIQSMTLSLLEAGELSVNPSLVAQQEVVRGDVNLYPGGITWVDPTYNEKEGVAIRTLDRDFSGIPLGIELRADIKQNIMEAFYLNKIALPPMQGGRQMTAYEIGQRVEEYIRGALPLFEPMEAEYSGGVCEDTFIELMNGGAFGADEDIPRNLRGQDITFRFESPLRDMADKQLGGKLMEAKALMAQVIDVDPGAAPILNARVALREALAAVTPASWVRDETEMKELNEEMAAQQQAESMMESMQAGATVAEQVGKAGIAMKEMAL
jgi:hypothetical protein